MRHIISNLTSGVAAIAAAAFFTGSVNAADLRYATGFAPNSTGAKAADAFAEKAKEISAGDLNIKVFAQSLLSFTEMSGGVRDNIADMGMVLFPYFPAEYPSATMISEMTMMFSLKETDFMGGPAWAGAFIEYVVLNCPKCQEELKAQNQVFTSTSATEYTMMCVKKVETSADLKGLRIRAPGAHWTRWAQSLGATSVAIPQNEIFEGLSQGILDCSLSGTAELIDLSLIDAVKFITDTVPGGGFGGTAQVNVNLDVWTGLTPEQRTNIAKAAVYQGAILSWNYRTNNAAALEKAKEKGIEIVTPSPELVDATHAFIEKDLGTIASNYASKYKLENTEQSVAKMRELYTKWVDLVADVKDGDALSELIWKETFAKVDMEKYGM